MSICTPLPPPPPKKKEWGGFLSFCFRLSSIAVLGAVKWKSSGGMKGSVSLQLRAKGTT